MYTHQSLYFRTILRRFRPPSIEVVWSKGIHPSFISNLAGSRQTLPSTMLWGRCYFNICNDSHIWLVQAVIKWWVLWPSLPASLSYVEIHKMSQKGEHNVLLTLHWFKSDVTNPLKLPISCGWTSWFWWLALCSLIVHNNRTMSNEWDNLAVKASDRFRLVRSEESVHD